MADLVEVPGFGLVRAVQSDDGAIRLESSATGSWIVELMPRVELSPTSSSSAPAPAAIGVAAALGAALPELAGLLQNAAPAA